MKIAARMEFDGFVDYKVAVTARRDTAVSDIRLEVPCSEDGARYMMGLGLQGRRSGPETFDWTWDQKKNQDALWLGDVNAGMQVGLRAENYSRPLNTNFYLSQAAQPAAVLVERRQGHGDRPNGPGRGAGPASGPRPSSCRRAGPRTIRAGETSTSISPCSSRPFKPIDPAAHFATRYFHAFKPLDEIAATGANVINVHHANAINPYINYPFLRAGRDEGLHRRRPPAAASRSRSTTPSASSPTGRPSSSPCAAWATRSSRPGRAAAIPGSRSTSAATTSPPGSSPSSRTPRSSTAACRAGTTTTSRASTGWPATSASTASTSTTSPSTGRP